MTLRWQDLSTVELDAVSDYEEMMREAESLWAAGEHDAGNAASDAAADYLSGEVRSQYTDPNGLLASQRFFMVWHLAVAPDA